MIVLDKTLTLPAQAESAGAVPGMLTGTQYLTIVDGLLAEGTDRPDFLPETKEVIPVNQGQARCHYISYKLICTGLVGVINAARLGSNQIQLLNNLYNSVYMDSSFQQAQAGAWANIQRIITEVSYMDISALLTVAMDLLTNLNSSIGNLRVGDQRWNASIQWQYDPAWWIYAVTSRQYRDQTGRYKNLPDNVSSLTAECFYLHTNDQKRLASLNPLAHFLPNMVGVYSAVDENGDPFIFSSNNKFDLPDETEAFSAPVYYIS